MRRKITFIIGLPGSGKSTWLKSIDKDKFHVFDDVHQEDEGLVGFKNALKNNDGKDIYVVDLTLMRRKVFNSAMNFLENQTDEKFDFHYIYFKSNADISFHNVKLRNDGRNVAPTINHLSKLIPEFEEFLTQLPNVKIIESKKYGVNNRKKLT
jgi:AAA15 family ATPase/GTPase